MRQLTSIRSKFAIGVFFISLLLAGVAGLIGYYNGRQNLNLCIERHLATIRDTKSFHIESYIRMVRNHVLVYSESYMVRDAAKWFVSTFRDIKAESLTPEQRERVLEHYRDQYFPELRKHAAEVPKLEDLIPADPAAMRLQYLYVASNPNPLNAKNLLEDAGDGSEYSRIHRKFHPVIDKLRTRFNYGNVLIFDPDSLVLVYSSMKRISLGSNFRNGPLAQTALAKAVAESASITDPEYVRVVDFETYLPDFGLPSAFALTPVLEEGHVIGVIAFEINSDAIYRILSDADRWESMGLAKSGEIVLVGPEGLMRSESRRYLQNPILYLEMLRSTGVPDSMIRKVEAFDSSVLAVQVRSQMTDRIAKGEAGTILAPDYLGTSVLASFAPLKVEGLDWGIVVKIPAEEVFAPLETYKRNMAIAFAGLTGLSMLFAAFAGASMAAPIAQLTTAARAYSNGFAEVRVNVESGDEIQALAETFNAMAQEIDEKNRRLKRKLQVNRRLVESLMPRMLFSKIRDVPESSGPESSQATLAFVEIEGIESAYDTRPPGEVNAFLDKLFASFDELSARRGVEKIGSGGATYLAACGLQNPVFDHSTRILDFARDICESLIVFNAEQVTSLSVSIGIHRGQISSNTSNRKKLFMDLWTRTVSLAADIQDVTSKSAIRVSQEVYDRVMNNPELQFVLDESDPNDIAWTLVLNQEMLAKPVFDRRPARPISPQPPKPPEAS